MQHALSCDSRRGWSVLWLFPVALDQLMTWQSSSDPTPSRDHYGFPATYTDIKVAERATKSTASRSSQHLYLGKWWIETLHSSESPGHSKSCSHLRLILRTPADLNSPTLRLFLFLTAIPFLVWYRLMPQYPAVRSCQARQRFSPTNQNIRMSLLTDIGAEILKIVKFCDKTC